MDDSYIINKSKELLIEFRRLLFGLFAEKGIIPNPKKTQIVKLRRGFTYLKPNSPCYPTARFYSSLAVRASSGSAAKSRSFSISCKRD